MRTMNNLEAWDIIRSKYLDRVGIMRYNDTAQYVMDSGEKNLLIKGEFNADELQAIGWFINTPEDFDYLRGFTDGQEADEVLSSGESIGA